MPAFAGMTDAPWRHADHATLACVFSQGRLGHIPQVTRNRRPNSWFGGVSTLASALPLWKAVADRVLIVEDETVLRKTLARLMARQGYEVVTASTLAEALDELAQSKFETLLLDVDLPDGDGLDFLAELGEGQRPQTVVMTALNRAEDEERARRLKVSNLIYKPFDLNEFLRRSPSPRAPGCVL
jgi:CheY-like chemotaxis protein